MSYRRLCKKSLLFRSLTGLTVPEFDQISSEIGSKYEEYERRRLSKRKRKRDVGAGRPFKLKPRERLLMLLVYYRLYITYALSGFLFDLDQSNVFRDLTILESLLKGCIPLPKKIYKRTKNLSQNYLSTDDHKTGELYQSKVVLCLLFIPCEQFSEPVVP